MNIDTNHKALEKTQKPKTQQDMLVERFRKLQTQPEKFREDTEQQLPQATLLHIYEYLDQHVPS